MLAPRLLGRRHDLLDLLDAGQHRAERDESRARRLGNEPRERRLAGARRSPEDDRLQPIAFDGFAQRSAGSKDVLLADELVEGGRTHPFGERRAGCCVAGRVRWRIVEEIHGFCCRNASYSTSAAATPTLSDSTGHASESRRADRLGCEDLRRQADAFACRERAPSAAANRRRRTAARRAAPARRRDGRLPQRVAASRRSLRARSAAAARCPSIRAAPSIRADRPCRGDATNAVAPAASAVR